MVEITKPDLTYIWGSGGSIVTPSSVKVQTGWQAEVPPYQWENYIQNRQDTFNVHVNQHGICVWDALTSYFTAKSYVQGSNGTVYVAVQNSGPATTTQDPTTDTTNVYWTPAVVSPKNLQNQTYSSFLTTGTSTAYVVTPSPALTSYTTNQRFGVTFHTQGTGSPTVNISGLGVKNLKQYDSTGTKITPTIAANQITDIIYDGTDFVIVDVLPASVGVRGAYKNLVATAIGTTATVTVTADEFVVESATGSYQTLRSVNISPSLTSSGVNGLDAGSATANTWYALYVIWNPSTGVVAGLFSTSYTSPTLPTGYTHYAFVESVRVGATNTKVYPFIKRGSDVFYTPTTGTDIPNDFIQVVSAGSAGTSTAVSLQSAVPPNATVAKMQLNHAGSTTGFSVVLRGASGNPSGLLCQAISNGTNGLRMNFEAPDPYNLGIYYAVSTSGTATILVAGWRS